MNTKETILWGVKVGDEDWQEQIITTDENQIEAAKEWASNNGFDRFRVAKIDLGVKPDFVNTLNMFEMGGEIHKRGGVVGQEIVFDDGGEENTGVIQEVNEITGDYVVDTDDGRTVLAQHDIDVISLGEMRKKPRDASRKKLFGLFEDGGNVDNKPDFNRMFNFLKDDLETLEVAIVDFKDYNSEDIDRFFSYWKHHLHSLKTESNDRMFNFLKDDLETLEVAIEEKNSEEIDRFFSYWTGDNGHIKSLKFEKGGEIEVGYGEKKAEQVWNGWNTKQRQHFLYDHNVTINRAMDKRISLYRFDELPIDLVNVIKYKLKEHIEQGQYAKGGNVEKNIYKLRAEGLNDFLAFLQNGMYFRVKSFTVEIIGVPDVVVSFETDASLSEIKSKLREIPDSHVMLQTIEPINEYTGERTDEYAKGGSVNSNLKDSTYIPNRDIVSITIKKDGKNVKLTSKDILDGIYYKGVSKEKQSNEKITKDESNTLPTSKVYGYNLYKAIQKFGISESEARSKYGNYTIKQWDELLNSSLEKSIKDAKKSIDFFTDGGIGMKYIKNNKFDAKYFESSMQERLNKSKLGRAESLIKLWSKELGMNPSKYIDGLIVEDIDFIKDSTERAKYLFSIIEKIKVNGLNGWMPGIDYVYYDKVTKKYFFNSTDNEILELKNDNTLAELQKFLKKSTTKMAKGGMTEHGLKVGDEIMGYTDSVNELHVINRKNNDEWHSVDLDDGKRYAKGGKTSSTGWKHKMK